MSKKDTKTPSAAPLVTVGVQEVKPTKQAASGILRVAPEKGAKLRGARAAWFAELIKHDGKPDSSYLEACKEKCPQLTKAGTAENPRGWLRFFQRTGAVTIEAPKA